MPCNQRQEITAVIRDRRGRELSRGTNSYTKTHPEQARWSRRAGLPPQRVYLHAEISALVRCRRRDRAHSITITRRSPDGKYRLAAPCAACAAAIKAAGISRIYHT